MKQSIVAYHDYVLHDVLNHVEGVTSRKMFGGYGIYLDGKIFAIITDDEELRFKVNDTNRTQYEEEGSTPFVYTGHKSKKPVTMNYYIVPERVLEDRECLEEWLRQSASL